MITKLSKPLTGGLLKISKYKRKQKYKWTEILVSKDNEILVSKDNEILIGKEGK